MKPMNMISNQLLHEKELAFFGKITASISHELNNVLSIINEYTGLLSDLCPGNGNDTVIQVERIQKITINIADQIQREQKLIKLLNRFAHRFDSPVLSFNLYELLNDVFMVSRRFAAFKKVSIEYTPKEEIVTITNNPFRLQFALFSCLELALGDSEAHDLISINLDRTEKHCILKISSQVKESNEGQKNLMELISTLVNIIKGKIEYNRDSNDHRTIKLMLSLSTGD